MTYISRLFFIFASKDHFLIILNFFFLLQVLAFRVLFCFSNRVSCSLFLQTQLIKITENLLLIFQNYPILNFFLKFCFLQWSVIFSSSRILQFTLLYFTFFNFILFFFVFVRIRFRVFCLYVAFCKIFFQNLLFPFSFVIFLEFSLLFL